MPLPHSEGMNVLRLCTGTPWPSHRALPAPTQSLLRANQKSKQNCLQPQASHSGGEEAGGPRRELGL